MGFSFKSIAIKGGTRDVVLATMGLRGTGTFEGNPESDITGVVLPSGWYLVTANRNPSAALGDATFQRLSQSLEVVTCHVEEHVMCSAVSFWSGGRQVWSVVHDAQKAIDHLVTMGRLPPIFGPISERLRAEQAAAGGTKADIDYIFDIPVRLATELTGYRYDRLMPELGDRAFEILDTVPVTPKRSLLRRLWGR